MYILNHNLICFQLAALKKHSKLNYRQLFSFINGNAFMFNIVKFLVNIFINIFITVHLNCNDTLMVHNFIKLSFGFLITFISVYVF